MPRGPLPTSFAPTAHALLRIVAGAAIFSHGAQKLFGWFGGAGPDGGTVELMTRFGAAGVIEVLGGALLMIGLLTRWAAFLLSGETAVAYFWMHVPNGGLWWWANRGELLMLFSFIFLYLAAAGAGPMSVDAALDEKRGGTRAG